MPRSSASIIWTRAITASGRRYFITLGVRKMRLITNHPVKRAAIEGFGLEITDRVPIEMEPNQTNEKVLRARKEKLGHLLTKV